MTAALGMAILVVTLFACHLALRAEFRPRAEPVLSLSLAPGALFVSLIAVSLLRTLLAWLFSAPS